MTTATQVKEKPILFSGPMVRAILDGRKMQTRRIIKPQPAKKSWGVPKCPDDWVWPHKGAPHWLTVSNRTNGPVGYTDECPYGRPGERLWVRESFKVSDNPHPPDGHVFATYLADGQHIEIDYSELAHNRIILGKSYPSIHMPRWASRLTLEITGIRVELLQDISPDDLTAEGYPPDNSPPHDGTRPTFHGRKMCFAESWDSLYEDRGYSWDSNPWVWVICFRRVE